MYSKLGEQMCGEGLGWCGCHGVKKVGYPIGRQAGSELCVVWL